MAIINQSSLILILIISYSVGLDLFGRSKIDTQETSLNVVSVSSLLIYLLIMFVYLVQNSKGYKIVALDGCQFLLFKDAG